MQELQNLLKRNFLLCATQDKFTNFTVAKSLYHNERQYIITLLWYHYKYSVSCIGINISVRPNTSMN